MDWNKLIDVIGTLSAAFAGSWSAFKLTAVNTNKQLVKSEIDAANRALFRRGRQYNTLLILRAQHLEEHRHKPTRHIMVRSIAKRDYSADYINQDSLQFLLEKEKGELLFDLLLENDRFINTIETLNSRSEYHDKIVQSKMEKLGKSMDLASLHKALGPRATVTIKNYTDDVYRFVDESCDTTYKLMMRFYNDMKTLYPSAKFVIFTTDEPIPPTAANTQGKLARDYSWK